MVLHTDYYHKGEVIIIIIIIYTFLSRRKLETSEAVYRILKYEKTTTMIISII